MDEQNVLTWHGLIVPVSRMPEYFRPIVLIHHLSNLTLVCYQQENAPYNKGAFRIEINFPAEYPFKPPKIAFKTKIYHPNIDEKGQVSISAFFTLIFKP